MKKMFLFLQQKSVVLMLALLFGASKNINMELGVWSSWVLLIMSGAISILIVWYLLSAWNVERRGYLITNIGSAFFMGLGFNLVLLAYQYELWNGYITIQDLILYWRFLLAFGIVGVCFGLLIEIHDFLHPE